MNANRYSIRFPREEHRLTLDMSEEEAMFLERILGEAARFLDRADGAAAAEDVEAINVVMDLLEKKEEAP